jgi:outer membrane protein OmpA-like peptidoglycan-associated protein
MKKSIFWLIALLTSVALWSQSAGSADELEKILNVPRLSCAETARFVLEAADLGVFPDPAVAFAYAQTRQWLPKEAEPDSPIRFDAVSLLVMRSFRIKGGLFYSIFKTPHYAYRELTYRSIVQGQTEPDMTVSGAQFLHLLGRVLMFREASPMGQLAELIRALLAAESVDDAGVRITEEGVTIDLFIFEADSAALAPSEKAKIDKIGRVLRQIPQRKILVAGHTALAGSPELRLNFSRERAQAVADYLISQEARTSGETTVRGYGAERPLIDHAQANQSPNRRVEITILEAQ